MAKTLFILRLNSKKTIPGNTARSIRRIPRMRMRPVTAAGTGMERASYSATGRSKH